MHSAGEQNRPERSRVRSAVVPGVAVVAVIAGAVMTAGAGGTGEFVTVGYAPLSEATFFPSPVLFLGPWTYAGIAILAAGLLALAFWSGYRTAKRR